MDGKLEIHVPKRFSPERPPVTYTNVDFSRMSIADHELASKLPVPTEQTSIQPNPYNLIDLAVRPGIPATIEEMVDRDLPQISLHVLSFRDATLVSISWPHSVMGSLGFKVFLDAWSLVLNSKESELPPLLDAKEDVLLDIENREPSSSRNRLAIQNHRLTGGKLLLFLLHYVWDRFWYPVTEVRSVFVPKPALKKLRDACRDEMSGTFSQAEYIDEESMLLAWFARFAASVRPANKPVTMLNFFNLKEQLASMFDQGGAYIGNMVGYSFSFLPGQVARGGLGPLVKEHLLQANAQSREGQCLSLLRKYRQVSQEGGIFKLFYGPADALVIGCNSFVNTALIHTVDFRAAASKDAETVNGSPPGAMTCFYYHIMKNRLGGGPDCIYLLGKDYGENLWVTAAMPDNAWNSIETALKEL